MARRAGARGGRRAGSCAGRRGAPERADDARGGEAVARRTLPGGPSTTPRRWRSTRRRRHSATGTRSARRCSPRSPESGDDPSPRTLARALRHRDRARLREAGARANYGFSPGDESTRALPLRRAMDGGGRGELWQANGFRAPSWTTRSCCRVDPHAAALEFFRTRKDALEKRERDERERRQRQHGGVASRARGRRSARGPGDHGRRGPQERRARPLRRPVLGARQPLPAPGRPARRGLDRERAAALPVARLRLLPARRQVARVRRRGDHLPARDPRRRGLRRRRARRPTSAPSPT